MQVTSSIPWALNRREDCRCFARYQPACWKPAQQNVVDCFRHFAGSIMYWCILLLDAALGGASGCGSEQNCWLGMGHHQLRGGLASVLVLGSPSFCCSASVGECPSTARLKYDNLCRYMCGQFPASTWVLVVWDFIGRFPLPNAFNRCG